MTLHEHHLWDRTAHSELPAIWKPIIELKESLKQEYYLCKKNTQEDFYLPNNE